MEVWGEWRKLCEAVGGVWCGSSDINGQFSSSALGSLWAELHPLTHDGALFWVKPGLCALPVCLGTAQGNCEHWGWRSHFPESFLCWCDSSHSSWLRAGPAGPGHHWDAAASGLSHIIFFSSCKGEGCGRLLFLHVCEFLSPSLLPSSLFQCFFKSHCSWPTARCNRNVTFSHCIYSLQTLCDKLGSPGCSWSFLLCKYNYLTLH